MVTGTLGAGRLRVGDELELGARRARVRGLQSLGSAVSEVDAVARVAVNLRGVELSDVRRGDALLTPGRFRVTDLIDVRLAGDPVADLPAALTLHVGSAAVPVRVRPLGPDTARLRLATGLPLRIGDRALLRDPGRHRVVGGVTVLDVAPPALRRRGAAAGRAAVLAAMDGCRRWPGSCAAAAWSGAPSWSGWASRSAMPRRSPGTGSPTRSTGRAAGPAGRGGGPVPRRAPAGARRAGRGAAAAPRPARPGAGRGAGRGAAAARAGRVGLAGRDTALPEPVARAVERVRADLAGGPFRAPEADRLAELGLGPREMAAAVRAGALLRLADSVVLLPGAVDDAAAVLAGLPQPFTLSAARQALDTTRRVAVPLLELLDRNGVTRRLPDDRRLLSPS